MIRLMLQLLLVAAIVAIILIGFWIAVVGTADCKAFVYCDDLMGPVQVPAT